MKLMFYLSSVALFGLGCTAIGQKKSPDHDFKGLWQPIVAYLNQDPKSALSASHTVGADLLQIYRDELAHIHEQWHRVSNQEVGEKNTMQKNDFIHRQIKELNDRDLESLRRTRTVEQSKKDYRAIAQEILFAVEAHPIASSQNIHSYREGDQIGFCFARALLVHYLLLKAGIGQQEIFKIFAVGDLLVGGQFWRFHVAVMVKDPKSGLVVIDPLQGEILLYEDWIRRVKRLEIKHPSSHARFYSADPRKFMPKAGAYEIDVLLQPLLKDYFYSLGAQLVSSN